MQRCCQVYKWTLWRHCSISTTVDFHYFAFVVSVLIADRSRSSRRSLPPGWTRASPTCGRKGRSWCPPSAPTTRPPGSTSTQPRCAQPCAKAAAGEKKTELGLLLYQVLASRRRQFRAVAFALTLTLYPQPTLPSIHNKPAGRERHRPLQHHGPCYGSDDLGWVHRRLLHRRREGGLQSHDLEPGPRHALVRVLLLQGARPAVVGRGHTVAAAGCSEQPVGVTIRPAATVATASTAAVAAAAAPPTVPRERMQRVRRVQMVRCRSQFLRPAFMAVCRVVPACTPLVCCVDSRDLGFPDSSFLCLTIASLTLRRCS